MFQVLVHNTHTNTTAGDHSIKLIAERLMLSVLRLPDAIVLSKHVTHNCKNVEAPQPADTVD